MAIPVPFAADDLPPAVALNRMARGYQLAQVLWVAAELGVADLLADGPRSSDALAARLGVHAGALGRVLRALAGCGVFAADEDGTFRLNRLAEPLRRDVPGSVREAIIGWCQPYVWRSWGGLLESVRTGEPAFARLHGMPLWEYLGQQPDLAANFDAALGSSVRHAALVAAYDFSALTRLVDVGGGNGQLLAAILQAYPSLHGVLFDQPRVVPEATAVLAEAGVAARCEVVGGDFFAAVPGGADGYLLSAVLGDWDDARAGRILANCRRAMGADARLLISCPLIGDRVESALAKLSDVMHLVVTGGGGRTEAGDAGAAGARRPGADRDDAVPRGLRTA